jgi:aryl-alcohol dehydrogenase-like predicted oxidoreductase
VEYKTLGNTGLLVSTLCLGTMTFHGGEGFWKAIGNVDQAGADELVKASVEAGINFFDTADVYSEGGSETTLGQSLKNLKIARKDAVIATKAFSRMGPGRNDVGASRGHIMDAVEASLRRLQTDHIDLYQMHHVDRSTPWEEIWQAMDLLVAQGKVTYIGSSNFAAWNIVAANEAARRRDTFGLVSEQSLYNLKTRAIELEVIPACEAYGVGILPWSPLGGGLLAGSIAEATEGRRSDGGMKAANEWLRDTIEAWDKLCVELGERPADVALAWLLSNPIVTAPIVGPRTMEQFEGSLRSLDIDLDGEVLKRIDEIFPGPGSAPEAYAW